MLKFPMEFEMHGSATEGLETLWEVSSQDLPPISCAIPPEFRGPGGAYSPEDLLGVAAISCLIATFKVFAKLSSLTFQDIKAKATLVVDRLQGKPAALTAIRIHLHVTGASDRGKALKLLEESKKNCLVTQALSLEKSYQFEVSE
jgi:organic hydroperoxide reductase OsmC/OhrA